MGRQTSDLTAPIGGSFRFRLFGSSDRRTVASKITVDFAIANFALIAASLCRLITSRQLSSGDPIGSVAERVNTTFLMNAAWFGVTAIGLLALTGFYRPLPSGRLPDRLIAAAKTCIAGFILQVLFGTIAMQRPLPAIELGIPAWTMLFAGLALTRLSRRSVSSFFHLIPKSQTVGATNIESILVVGGAGYVGS